MIVAVAGMDSLGERAAKMREALQKSQTITDNVVTILGSFDSRLSVLETAMRPTQIRTHAIRKAHENIDKTLKAAEVILTQFDASRQAEAKILKGPHEDLESYLEAINQLRSNIRFFSGNKGFKSSDAVINNANTLLTKAISKLEDEFKQLLALYSKPVEPDRLFECLPESMRPSSESPGNQFSGKNHHHEHQNGTSEIGGFKHLTLIPPRILPLLHDLALQMVQAGNQQQLLRIYRDTRSSVLEESLRKLGVEKLSKEDVQRMQWEVLEAKIGNWIHFMRIAVKVLFVGERRVCDQIFEGFDTLLDQCFAECTTGSVSMLLSFGDAIARSKRSPEKLFVLLDMYEIMRELHSEVEGVFGGKACKEIRESTFGLTKRLAQTAQETFGDFEEAVEKDATKTAVLDGTVHPLTSYVINYVKFLFDYQTTLKQLFQEFESSGETNSQLANVTMRIMQALQTNLDGKSKQYRDPALTHLFLMNNIHYMVRSVRRSQGLIRG
uniref:Exocyst subunit Exo70 family protein n=1 Tax=Salix viminalis TaxID=40686 RepID=A0A6N2M453_SALVM